MNENGWYGTATAVIAGIVGVVTFFGSWLALAGSYGLLGIALGWFPAGFLAAMAALLTAVLWPLAALGIVALVVLMAK